MKTLADFLRVDENLLEVAAAGSTGEAAAGPSRDEMVRWVETLPTSEKDAYLVRFLANEGDIGLRAELSRRFRKATAPRGKGHNAAGERRTIAQLLTARDKLADEKARKTAEKAAKERERREREAAEARTKFLDAMAGREPEWWRKVDQLIATKRPQDYDRAVALLVDLRELAERSGGSDEAMKRVRELRERHSNKPSLLKRLTEKKLGI